MSKQRKLSNGFNLAAKQTIIIANIKLLTAFLRFIVLLNKFKQQEKKQRKMLSTLAKAFLSYARQPGVRPS